MSYFRDSVDVLYNNQLARIDTLEGIKKICSEPYLFPQFEDIEDVFTKVAIILTTTHTYTEKYEIFLHFAKQLKPIVEHAHRKRNFTFYHAAELDNKYFPSTIERHWWWQAWNFGPMGEVSRTRFGQCFSDKNEKFATDIVFHSHGLLTCCIAQDFPVMPVGTHWHSDETVLPGMPTTQSSLFDCDQFWESEKHRHRIDQKH